MSDEGPVNALIGVGIILLVSSAMWLLLNESVNEIEEEYGMGEAPFQLMKIGWNVMLTVALILIGISLIVAGGIMHRRRAG